MSDDRFAKYVEDRALSFARERGLEPESATGHLAIGAWMLGYAAGCEDME